MHVDDAIAVNDILHTLQRHGLLINYYFSPDNAAQAGRNVYLNNQFWELVPESLDGKPKETVRSELGGYLGLC